MSELKKTVQEKTGISPNEQWLIFAGKQLNDKDYLNQYPALGAGSTIYLLKEECDTSGILAQMSIFPLTEVVGVSCPSIRLCPNCGTPIEHTGGCKQMTCRPCQTDFCFICLRIKTSGSWQCGSYNTKCAVAPIQTSVPKKN